MFKDILIGIGLSATEVGGYLFLVALGVTIGYVVFRLAYAKEIAIAKQLYAAGYTKIEQIAAFIRKIA